MTASKVPRDVVVFYHPIFEHHLEGIQHPECPERLKSIRRFLDQQGFWKELRRVEPAMADQKWIESNHAPSYIRSVEQACQSPPAVLDQGDTVVTSESYRAARYAVGAAIEAVDQVMHRETKTVFCALRPPGHHAEYDQAMGFCLFNHVAIAANYALQRHGLERVFILDWDVHHGNGTQHSFEDRADVFYCSIHQWPLYPGTGAASERGRGVGEGFTLNIPLPAGSGDEVYFRVMRDRVMPEIEKFAPQLILISAGFDAHAGDPLAGMQLSTEAFDHLTRMIGQAARRVRAGGIISLLEGGYHLAHLAESVWVHLQALNDIAGEL